MDREALDLFLKEQSKRFGNGILMDLGISAPVKAETLSTGILGFDIALGGGIAKGRLIELFGPEASGKTSLSLMTLGVEQKKGGLCALIDLEQTFDPVYASKLGVDVDKLLLSQPSYGEQALDLLQSMVESGLFSCIIFDSIAAIVPKSELDGDAGEMKLGVTARLMSQATRKLVAIAKKTNTTIIFINQLREKIGVMYGCLHADSPVMFSDGREIPIREVVENRIEGKVWSYNESKGQLEENEIVDWHFNGEVSSNKDYLNIFVDSGNYPHKVTVTPSHEVFTLGGWVKAKDLKVGQSVICLNGEKKEDVKRYSYTGFITAISNTTDEQMEQKGKYDISVHNNHNYIAGGILVHNSPETTPGGNAMKFNASQRIDIRKGQALKDKDTVIGGTMKLKVVKNKIAPPFKTSELPVYYSTGPDKTTDLLNVGVHFEVLHKTGSHFHYGETKLGNGIAAARQTLLENPDLYDELFKLITEKNENSLGIKG